LGNERHHSVKDMIVRELHLKVTPAAIDDRAPLFGDGLGLDSIDALELVVAIEREYGVRIENEKEGRKALASVEALTQYLQEKGGFRT